MDPINPLITDWIAGGTTAAVVVAAIYLVPTWIAIARDVPQKVAIFQLNVLFGWSIIL
jgi:hypothetical protein